MKKLKKSDQIIILSGKDKGKKGKVEKIFSKDMTVLIPGLNLYKRHVKKREEGKQSGVIELSRPVAISRVALVCPKCNKATRVGFTLKGEKKMRLCKKCHAQFV